MDQELAALHQKLDLLTEQVHYLTEQAELAARRQAERAELVSDLTPIANDVFRLTTEQLEEIQEYVDLGDLLRLLKRSLRNGRNIDQALDRLESLMDLAQTVGPVTDSLFEKATTLLQRAECHGYFTFAHRGARLANSVVSAITQFAPPSKTSLWSLLKQARDQNVRRGLVLAMHVLGAVGGQAAKCAEEAAMSGDIPGPCTQPVPAAPCAGQ
ncbi:MAG: DUF1641 domain-containing protein [Gaiellales bacterium]|nr:DUF1641 domain-containing protein [Gaiellales bacterium]